MRAWWEKMKIRVRTPPVHKQLLPPSFAVYDPSRSWSSWKRPYWTTSLTGIRSKPTMSHPYRCPDPPRTSPGDTHTQTPPARSCSVSLWMLPCYQWANTTRTSVFTALPWHCGRIRFFINVCVRVHIYVYVSVCVCLWLFRFSVSIRAWIWRWYSCNV